MMSIWGILAFVLIGFAPLQAEKRTVKNENSGDEYTDLQVAIDTASPGDVLVAKGTFVGSFVIDKSLTLDGKSKTVLDGNKVGRVLSIADSSSTVTVRNLIVQNGLANLGAGIENVATLNLENVHVINNIATTGGGGIYNEKSKGVGGFLNILDSKISNNHAPEGGGIRSDFAFVIIGRSKISHNVATETGGGGLLFLGGQAAISHSEIEENSAVNPAGGIWQQNSNFLSLFKVEIEKNSSQEDGGGIYNSNSVLGIDQSKLTKNTARFFAGALLNSGIATISNSELKNNSATDGGAIFNLGLLNLIDDKFSNNVPNDVSAP